MTVHRERVPLENAVAAQFPAFQPVADACAAMWKQAGEFQLEMLRFMTERIEKDMAYSSKLLGCKNPDEMFRAHSDFCSCFFDDYLKEGGRVGDLVSTATKETQRSFERGNGGAGKH
jgi:hypothetical protein